MPAVSVTLVFHQVTPHLRPAVRSILDQTWRDLELVVVDNGTGAGRAALGEEGRDPRVQLISLATNRGVAAGYNAANRAATGEFVAHMDSDDIALPERIARQVAALRADPGLGVLATHALVIDETGTVRRPQFTLDRERDERIYAAYSLPITNPTIMARREIFEAFPLREEFSLASDFDFFARVVERHPCRALPEPLLHYRRHAAQVTTSRAAEMIFNACQIRLVTARRRAGRPEQLAELQAALRGSLPPVPAAADSYAHFARLALAEGFSLLAVFLGRRHFSVRRTAAGLAVATDILRRALAQSPRLAATLLRMYFTGPLRTHGLRPL